MKAPELVVSATPHIHSGNSVRKMMLNLIVALIPAIAVSMYFFGTDVLRVVGISVVSAVVWEAIFQKMMGKKVAINDLTAVASGLILAAILPPTLPWWMIVIATLIMILLGKEIYGGLGCNPFNGVLVAYVVLRISYPEAMIAWKPPVGDIMTELPPLQVLRDEGVAVLGIYFPWKDLVIGRVAGTVGEGCKIALLVGGLFLFLRRNFSWHIPVGFLAGMAVLSGLLWVANPEKYASPVFHLLAGGSLLAAFFLATDSTTSPVTPIGMVLSGLIAGMLTVVIRSWAQWEDGAYFAVFMVGTLTPLLDMIKPRIYGRVKASASS